jgi:hypothetical protein
MCHWTHSALFRYKISDFFSSLLGANALKLGKAKMGLMAILLLGFISCIFGMPLYIDFTYASRMPTSSQIGTGRNYPYNVNPLRGEYSVRYVNKGELERAEFADKLTVYGGLFFFAGIGVLKVYWKEL